jgi:hypothetical protein
MSMIAFSGDALRMRGMSDASRKSVVLLAAVLGLRSGGLRAQDSAAPPPPPEQKQPNRPPQDGQPYRPGPGRGGMMPGNPGMYPRGDREHSEAFNRLPEEERRRVRAAFEKAWNKPDVVQARDRLMKANEEYRQTLHHALEEADSGVVRILEKVKTPMPGGGFPFAGRLPDPTDAEFSRKVIARLAEELQSWARNEKRDLPVGRLHERVMGSPAVGDLARQLEAATEPQRRMEIAVKLREAYLAGWRMEFGPGREGPAPRREGPPGGRPERKDNPPPQGPEKK